jgi:parallel beta-helix repeat protein
MAPAIPAAILIALSGMAAQAQTGITTCPYTINTSGFYEVKNELDCFATDGITITASNVTLKLNGFTISGSFNGAPSAVDPVTGAILPASDTVRGISVNFNGPGRLQQVNIEGPGFIRKFGTGVFYQNTDFSQVNGVTTADNVIGFGVSGSTFMTLGSNSAGANKTADDLQEAAIGIFLDRCVNCQVTGNDASGNQVGLLVFEGALNQVHGNTANGNTAIGIKLDGTPLALAFGNTCNGNYYGIEVASGAGNQIFSNTNVRGNTIDLLGDPGTCTTNLWTNNSFFIGFPSCVR